MAEAEYMPRLLFFLRKIPQNSSENAATTNKFSFHRELTLTRQTAISALPGAVEGKLRTRATNGGGLVLGRTEADFASCKYLLEDLLESS